MRNYMRTISHFRYLVRHFGNTTQWGKDVMKAPVLYLTHMYNLSPIPETLPIKESQETLDNRRYLVVKNGVEVFLRYVIEIEDMQREDFIVDIDDESKHVTITSVEHSKFVEIKLETHEDVHLPDGLIIRDYRYDVA